jgi:hypothetical protein
MCGEKRKNYVRLHVKVNFTLNVWRSKYNQTVSGSSLLLFFSFLFFILFGF